MKIYVLIVTYNRLSLLKKVIDAIGMQTYPIYKIVVVNNSSTDGTGIWLLNQTNIHVINQENLGGAGGFHFGIKYCFQDGADWVWMMDDDVFPSEDCLEQLMKFSGESECLQMTRYWKDGGLVPQCFIYDLKNNSIQQIEQCMTCDYTEINCGCFEGMLISKRVISLIGLPDKRFFISGDDTIYGYLAAQYTKILVVSSAVAYRAMKQSDLSPRPMYIYYTMRNYHILQEYCTKMYNRKFSIRARLFHFRSFLIGYLKNIIMGRRSIANAYLRGYIDSHMKIIGRSY